MADPLSIAATKLPGSSFDPVEFASEERKRLLNEQAERRTRYNQMADQIASVSSENPWDQGLREAKSNLMDEMGSRMADGVDITDYSNKETGKLAWEYKNKINKLLGDAQMSKLIKDLVDNTQQMLAKDDAARGGKNAYNRTATIDNIKGLMATKNIDEANKYLSERGDNLLVANPRYVNIQELIEKNLPDAFKRTVSTIEGGQLVKRGYQEYSPQELRTVFSSILNDPDAERTIKRDKGEDPTSINESDLDYMMRTYGNQLTRKQVLEDKQPYVPKSTKENEDKPKPVEQSVEPEKISIVIKSGGVDKKYSATGENTYTYDQSKTPNLILGKGVIDINTGEKIPSNSDFVDFTPISSSEYYVTKEKIRGESLFEPYKEGMILPDNRMADRKSAKKQRFVLGVYTEGSGDNKVKRTVLVPYENVKNSLDKIYGVEGGLPTSKSTNIEDLRSKYQY